MIPSGGTKEDDMEEQIHDCVEEDGVEMVIELIEDDWVDETDRRLEVMESAIFDLNQMLSEYTTGRSRVSEMPQSNFGQLLTDE